jgi:hypothetical protein
MRYLAARIATVALLLMTLVGAAPPSKPTTAAPVKKPQPPEPEHPNGLFGIPEPPQPERQARPLWQRDPTAKQFYQLGRARSRRDAGSPPLQVPSLEKRVAAFMQSSEAGDLISPADPRVWTSEMALRYLAIFYGADSDAPDVRRARAREPLMEEARKLYQVLKTAPPRRQAACVAAFQAGLVRGFDEDHQRFEAELEKERAAERRRLKAHRRLTKTLLARTPTEDLPGLVVDYVNNKIGDSDKDFPIVKRLPRPVQLVFAMHFMKNLVDGDGFEPLMEGDAWQYAPLAAEGYQLVGARQRAAVMRRAIAVMPREKAKKAAEEKRLLQETPEDKPSEDEPSEEESENGNPVFSALDDAFYALDRTGKEDVYRLIARYIRRHPEQFVAK